MLNRSGGTKQPDTFICHASEDKDFMALPLYEALSEAGVYAWLDESEIRLGDSIRQKIDDGLANCRSATVIPVQAILQEKLDSIRDGRDRRKEDARRDPALPHPARHHHRRNRRLQSVPGRPSVYGNSSSYSCERIAVEIASQLEVKSQAPTGTSAGQTNRLLGTLTVTDGVRTFGRIYIAPAGTPELPERERT